ncbi:MAG: 3-hydroxyacyl-CoA dehydrogenase family protein [Bacteroidetes bacterium]|nr:3-hydroxyacyl-CoA dehydrogenase family protein [Bacteroidota bacterium]
MKQIATIGVAGAGAMGLGIAQVFAQHQFKVLLFDVQAQQIEKAQQQITHNLSAAVAKGKMTEAEKTNALSLVQYTTDVQALRADLVVEAIVEKIEVKRELFQTLAAINAPDTLLTSNTSSIPITRIAQGIPHPQRIAGLHFFNPAHLMKLVEIIAAADTDPEVIKTLEQLVGRIGKTAVVCKDSPGFIVNRVHAHPSRTATIERQLERPLVPAHCSGCGFVRIQSYPEQNVF